MLDEFVDRDMSIQYGRWFDFEIELIEEGIEIEKEILVFLVDELVDEFVYNIIGILDSSFINLFFILM